MRTKIIVFLIQCYLIACISCSSRQTPQINYAIIPRFDEAASFSEGLALVKVGGKYGYIDTTGTLKILPQFENAGSFSEGLAPVLTRNQQGKKWGYIDRSGNFAIFPSFIEAGTFSQGRAPVKTKDGFLSKRWGYIDHKGTLVMRIKS